MFKCVQVRTHACNFEGNGLLSHFGTEVSDTFLGCAMISKQARGYTESDIPHEKRLRRNLTDLYLTSDVSALRAASLLTDAAAANATHVSDLVPKPGTTMKIRHGI